MRWKWEEITALVALIAFALICNWNKGKRMLRKIKYLEWLQK